MLPFVARARTLGLSIALATAGLGGAATIPASADDSATTWHVQAGNADDPTFTSLAQEVTTFYPARITVHAGDDVAFSAVGFHTVTFNPVRIPGGPPTFAYADPAFGGFSNNPLTIANKPGGLPLNAGGFGDGGPPGTSTGYTLHIDANAAGGDRENRARAANGKNGDEGKRGTTYQYFCMLHRDMTGFITVLPGGSGLPATDAQNQARAAAAKAADLARGAAALRKASRNVEDNQVAAGLGLGSVQGAGATTILRFAPATIEINAGQSVTWINKDINAPHTVTFGVEIPGPPGAPPGFLPYGGSTVSSTSDQVNSGFLVSQQLIDYLNVSSMIPPGFVVTRRVNFAFPRAGTYHYFCALHDFLGMVGTVVVRDASGGGD
jgi:plastocyanin